MNPIILLVDLASAERENWKALLENQNYDVIIANNAESARQMCLRLQPDLVLLLDQDRLNLLNPGVSISSKRT